jgi:hypothetical protein
LNKIIPALFNNLISFSYVINTYKPVRYFFTKNFVNNARNNILINRLKAVLEFRTEALNLIYLLIKRVHFNVHSINDSL